MKNIGVRVSLLAVLTALLLLACETLPAGFESTDENVVRHTITGMEFPPQISGFQRLGATTYDGTGRDVSVGYVVSRPAQCNVTFYIYPADAGLSEHTAELKTMIESHHPGAVLVSESETEHVHSGVTYPGTLLIYRYDEIRRMHVGNAILQTTEPAESRAYLFIYEEWYMMYRITYPEESRDEIELYLSSFIERLAWP